MSLRYLATNPKMEAQASSLTSPRMGRSPFDDLSDPQYGIVANQTVDVSQALHMPQTLFAYSNVGTAAELRARAQKIRDMKREAFKSPDGDNDEPLRTPPSTPSPASSVAQAASQKESLTKKALQYGSGAKSDGATDSGSLETPTNDPLGIHGPLGLTPPTPRTPAAQAPDTPAIFRIDYDETLGFSFEERLAACERC